jgi:hypothetical protein
LALKLLIDVNTDATDPVMPFGLTRVAAQP